MVYRVRTLRIEEGETRSLAAGEHIIAVLKTHETNGNPNAWYLTALVESE